MIERESDSHITHSWRGLPPARSACGIVEHEMAPCAGQGLSFFSARHSHPESHFQRDVDTAQSTKLTALRSEPGTSPGPSLLPHPVLKCQVENPLEHKAIQGHTKSFHIISIIFLREKNVPQIAKKGGVSVCPLGIGKSCETMELFPVPSMKSPYRTFLARPLR